MSVGSPSRRRALAAFAVLAVGQAVVLRALFASHGQKAGADFAAFYAVSHLLQTHQPIPSPEGLLRLAEALLGLRIDALYPWPYPPMGRLLMYPLAWVPLPLAFVSAMALGLAGYLSAVRRIVGPRADLVWAALAFPAVGVTVVYGQTTFITAALLGWGLALLPHRPRAAGVLLGLLCFKPHLALLVPVALAAGRRWRALLAAAATSIGFAAAGTAVFGWQAWSDFFRSAQAFTEYLGVDAARHFFYQSVFAAVRLAGGGVAIAWIAQGVAATAAAAGVWRTWSGPASDAVKSAALVLGSLLATPHLSDYDLVLLALPIAFLVRDARERGERLPGTLTLLTAALVPPLARSTSRILHLAPGPWLTLLLWCACIRRGRETEAAVPSDVRAARPAPDLPVAP
jgi:hypothetical protein